MSRDYIAVLCGGRPVKLPPLAEATNLPRATPRRVAKQDRGALLTQPTLLRQSLRVLTGGHGERSHRTTTILPAGHTSHDKTTLQIVKC